MSISIRAAQIAGVGLLFLGGCTVNNQPPTAPIIVREQSAPTTTVVTPSGLSAPSTVILQPR